jgi:hypothetical protein
MFEDRGLWEVEVEIAGDWYEPFMALQALEQQPHQQRALSHAERRAATLNAYNSRWTQGASDAS